MPKGKIVAVGHIMLLTQDVNGLVDFYKKVLGLKQVVKSDYFNAFEVGDVHFCIMQGEHHATSLDFTSDDVDALRDRLLVAGINCTECQDDAQSGHRWFVLTDPDKHKIRINSAHQPMPAVA